MCSVGTWSAHVSHMFIWPHDVTATVRLSTQKLMEGQKKTPQPFRLHRRCSRYITVPMLLKLQISSLGSEERSRAASHLLLSTKRPVPHQHHICGVYQGKYMQTCSSPPGPCGREAGTPSAPLPWSL